MESLNSQGLHLKLRRLATRFRARPFVTTLIPGEALFFVPLTALRMTAPPLSWMWSPAGTGFLPAQADFRGTSAEVNVGGDWSVRFKDGSRHSS